MSTQNPVDQADGATSAPQAMESARSRAELQECLQRAIHRYGALRYDLEVTFPAQRKATTDEMYVVQSDIGTLLAEINRGAK